MDIKIDAVQYRFVVKRHAEVPQADQLLGHVSSPISIKNFSALFTGLSIRLFSLLRGNLSRRNSAI
jgi:hypothetical protein